MIYLLIFRGGRNEINTFWYCDNRRTAFGLNACANFVTQAMIARLLPVQPAAAVERALEPHSEKG
jgi:hypothetical protein